MGNHSAISNNLAAGLVTERQKILSRLSRLKNQRALTLIELLLVLTIAGILLQSALASFQNTLASARSGAALRGISSLFAVARQQALLERTPITVCAVDRTGRCQRSWTGEHQITVFLDRNRNRSHDATEPAYRELRWPMVGGELSWRASLGRPYIVFEETGGTWQNGTLYYCPANRDSRQARALVLSHSGRSYLTTDSNGDGLREDRLGRNLRC